VLPRGDGDHAEGRGEVRVPQQQGKSRGVPLQGQEKKEEAETQVQEVVLIVTS